MTSERTRPVSWILQMLLTALTALWLSSAAEAQQPDRGGTLKMIITPEPASLVGAFTTVSQVLIVSPKIHDGLVSYDFDFNMKPALATSWSVSRDGKEITFRLRKDVKWHDGKDFTAADVAFSVMKAWKVAHSRGRATFANVTAVETPDPHTAIFRLSAPAPYILSALAASESQIIPKHIYDGTTVETNPNNVAPVGTGPFKFKEWKRGSYIILERNPNYWDAPKPYLDRIVFLVIPDAAARAVALETGEADMAGMNPVPLYDVQRLASLPQIGLETRGYEYQSIVAQAEFNLSNPYLKHLKVRQAIAHAIDKDFIAKNIWYGFATPATGPISSSLSRFYTDKVRRYEFNPAKAEQLLDEAGFKRGPDGVRFRLIHDFLPGTDVFQHTAEYIKQALGKVGIEVTLRSQDFPTYVRRVYTDRDFDMTNHWINNAFDPTVGVQRLFWSKSIQKGVPFSNASGYSSPEMDKVLAAAQVEIDPAVRVQLFHRMQQIATEDLPILSIADVKVVTIYNKKVRNHTISPDGIYAPFAEVFIRK